MSCSGCGRPQDSLARYPHQVIDVTANNVTGPALEWAEANSIDILILGAIRTAVRRDRLLLVPLPLSQSDRGWFSVRLFCDIWS